MLILSTGGPHWSIPMHVLPQRHIFNKAVTAHSKPCTMSSVEISAIMQANASLKQQFADKERLGRSLFVEKVFKSDANVMLYTGIPSQAMFML